MLVQLLTSALTCLALLAVYVYRLQLQRDAAANEHGCHLAVRHRSKEPFSGIDFHMEMHVDIPSLHRYHQHYGKTFQLQSLIAQPAVMTLAPINIKAVNTAKDFGIEPMRLSGMEYFCGRGFLTTDGDIWQHSRKLLKPGFAKSNLINLDFLSQQVDNILSQLPAEGDTVDLQPLLYTMFLNTSVHFLLGIDTTKHHNGPPHSSSEFIEAFHDALFYTMFKILLGRVWSLLPQKKYLDACKRAHEYLDYYIDQALSKQKSEDTKDSQSKKPSLLASLSSQSDNLAFIRAQILQGMMASQETTSALLGNAFFLLSRNTNYWKQVRAEAISTESKEADFDTLLNFKTIRNVLLETLRLYPVFPLLARGALADTQLPTGGGPNQDQPIFLPKNTIIVLSYYALHRDQTVFGEDVEDFRPERWETIEPGAWDFMGFGGGNRACMGQQKVLVEAAYVLVRFAKKFSKLESRDSSAWEGEMKLTCKSKNGCKIALSL